MTCKCNKIFQQSLRNFCFSFLPLFYKLSGITFSWADGNNKGMCVPCCAELEGNGKLPNGHSGHKSQANSSSLNPLVELRSFRWFQGSQALARPLFHASMTNADLTAGKAVCGPW